LPVRRVKRTAIITQLVGQPLCAASIGLHRIDFQVAVTRGSEDDLLAVGRNCGLGVVTRSPRELPQDFSIDRSVEDLERRIDGPDVPFGIVRTRRACGTGQMSGGIEKVPAVAKEKAASCPALTG